VNFIISFLFVIFKSFSWIDNVSVLLEFDAASLGTSFPTFNDNIFVTCTGKKSQSKIRGDLRALEDENTTFSRSVGNRTFRAATPHPNELTSLPFWLGKQNPLSFQRLLNFVVANYF
jgi:hypothetical protein